MPHIRVWRQEEYIDSLFDLEDSSTFPNYIPDTPVKQVISFLVPQTDQHSDLIVEVGLRDLSFENDPEATSKVGIVS